MNAAAGASHDRFELAGGWHLQRVQVGDHFEWIICDPAGDRLGGTLKHMADLDSALLGKLIASEPKPHFMKVHR